MIILCGGCFPLKDARRRLDSYNSCRSNTSASVFFNGFDCRQVHGSEEAMKKKKMCQRSGGGGP